jgi:hypothetical protein
LVSLFCGSLSSGLRAVTADILAAAMHKRPAILLDLKLAHQGRTDVIVASIATDGGAKTSGSETVNRATSLALQPQSSCINFRTLTAPAFNVTW